MTNFNTIDINTFCPLGLEIKTAEINGDTWVIFDEDLSRVLQHPHSLRGLLPAHEIQTMKIADQEADLISERLFYQIVLGSDAAGAIEFRNWVASKLLWRWYETTGDPQDIHNAERLLHAPTSVMGAIEAIVSEYLPTSRHSPIS
jgi:prophage antirepressor-like protein